MQSIALEETKSRTPFSIGLHYNAPARGVWNIANMAMMLPESHVIFVCPAGCMRGVTLTAAQMGAMERFTAIFVTEQEVLEGSGDRLIIDGVSETLDALLRPPKAVTLFTSCIDQFLGTDHKQVFGMLKERYPKIGFIECFMTPTMRKGALPPDPTMRKQMYALLKPSARRKKQVNFIGNNLPLPEENEFKQVISRAGYKSMDIADLNYFSEYESMAESCLNIMIHPNGVLAVNDLTKRLKIEELRIPLSYKKEKIESDFKQLSNRLGMSCEEAEQILLSSRQEAEKALAEAKKIIGKRPVSIDYTMTTRPFGLARFLAEEGFHVTDIYAESCLLEEEEDYLWLKEKNGRMLWHYPMDPSMARFKSNVGPDRLALGQIAAYFSNTGHFVNVVESDGLYGFHGIKRLMELMIEAVCEEKDLEQVIQVKALGCFKKEVSGNGTGN